MRHIDWRAVILACEGVAMGPLDATEKRMAIRRLNDRMVNARDTGNYAMRTDGKLTSDEVARRLRTTDRNVVRMRSELPPANPMGCPECGEDMWVIKATGIVEPHPDRFADECRASGHPARTGLAAIRPELYAWIEVGA